ncbi:type I-U CRISPR-associated protein Csb2 [Methylomonas sp. SURF-2]|uniref:Type I-U CRISPR-associated protein Csb2 n=1 Tax=Methylomonas subterranea TaxID=2952225 RepID=A0ABT1TLP9_9GAMM|nr:type I-U CRISPR-associated protein Csb2 [Methylomonas sp. SURF-2]MCQ8106239.1 type I-U CRISPR-associated protein Csb2 [Methylomonas sp. SURF-2]
MFSLGIRYLNGWAMAAADGAKKQVAEWPPHPGRVYMALAAAWFETGQNPAEQEALGWLETLVPPDIHCSDAKQRESVNVYVPVNDSATPYENEKKGVLAPTVGGYPLGRKRRDRRFPVAIPFNPDVHIVWDAEPTDQQKVALISLTRKVVSIGHSASLVQMWFDPQPPESNWKKADYLATHKFRVPCSGRLQYLAKQANRESVIRYSDLQAEQQRLQDSKKTVDKARKEQIKDLKGADKKNAELPFRQKLSVIDERLEQLGSELARSEKPISLRPDDPGVWQGYRKVIAKDITQQSVIYQAIFDPNFIVLKLSGKRLNLQSTLKLTQALRGALMKNQPAPMPEWLSGHAENGRASRNPHIALFPLPFVGSEHADGRIMGLGIALPQSVDLQQAAAIFEPWLRNEEDWQPRKIKLFDGQWLECGAELDTRESPPTNLQIKTWTRPSKVWASVTPVVLDRHFDGKDKWEQAAESVKDGCERLGLPRPAEVLLHPVSLFEGVPHSKEFPYITRKTDGGRLHHAHAVLVFEQAVSGPILICAGRFRGYGLCRPWFDKGEFNG